MSQQHSPQFTLYFLLQAISNVANSNPSIVTTPLVQTVVTPVVKAATIQLRCEVVPIESAWPGFGDIVVRLQSLTNVCYMTLKF